MISPAPTSHAPGDTFGMSPMPPIMIRNSAQPIPSRRRSRAGRAVGWLLTFALIFVLIVVPPFCLRNLNSSHRARRDPRHRDQRQAQIATLRQQAVQRGLVGDRPGEDRLAARLVRDPHAVEPLRPPFPEVPSDPNLIDVCHGLPVSAAAI